MCVNVCDRLRMTIDGSQWFMYEDQLAISMFYSTAFCVCTCVLRLGHHNLIYDSLFVVTHTQWNRVEL